MKLIVNRTDEWFNTEFPEYDHYYICMKLLEKASRNQIRGLTYDKIKLVSTAWRFTFWKVNRKNAPALRSNSKPE